MSSSARRAAPRQRAAGQVEPRSAWVRVLSRYCRGQLSPSELHALLACAQREAELALAVEAYAPLARSTRRRIVLAILAALQDACEHGAGCD